MDASSPARAVPTIAVIDSGYGNLRSVAKALDKVGGRPVVTADPDEIRRADKVLVPGQGAFSQCVEALASRGLESALREAIDSGRPYLGLCLGLQVLFEDSEEHGNPRGLGLVPGHVVRFRLDDPTLKVPHMGWNQVSPGAAGRDPLLDGIAEDAYFYFVHSYYVVPDDPSIVALTCRYGHEFAVAVRKDNLFACQFHPEKSGKVGLDLLRNFAVKS